MYWFLLTALMAQADEAPRQVALTAVRFPSPHCSAADDGSVDKSRANTFERVRSQRILLHEGKKNVAEEPVVDTTTDVLGMARFSVVPGTYCLVTEPYVSVKSQAEPLPSYMKAGCVEKERQSCLALITVEPGEGRQAIEVQFPQERCEWQRHPCDKRGPGEPPG